LRGKKVTRAACLAHIRRKFESARAERPEVIDWILRIIARLYMIETPLREYQTEAQVRFRVRQNNSRPLLALLGKAFKRLINTRIRPKSGLGQALQYALGQWPAMQTFLEDGRVEIDNNDTYAERGINEVMVSISRTPWLRQWRIFSHWLRV
jgi:hypothetical protein